MISYFITSFFYSPYVRVWCFRADFIAKLCFLPNSLKYIYVRWILFHFGVEIVFVANALIYHTMSSIQNINNLFPTDIAFYLNFNIFIRIENVMIHSNIQAVKYVCNVECVFFFSSVHESIINT